MNAYFLDQPELAISGDDLARHGVFYRQLPVAEADYAESLQKLRDERGYVQMDEVRLNEQTPNLAGLLDKFFKEHLHTDEEIRFLTDGAGIFDLRDDQDRWMRVHVVAGDLIIVPANLHHRFALDEQKSIVCKRLFQNTLGWEAVLRA